MRPRLFFQFLLPVVLATILFGSTSCVDPNGNLNLLTGTTTNSLTSDGGEVETIDAVESDNIIEDIPIEGEVDISSEPITMPVTISKLDSDYLIKATYIRGGAILDTEDEAYQATLWSWLHGTAIAADDATVMVYGAKGCVSPYAKLTVSLAADEFDSDDDKEDASEDDTADTDATDASDVDAGVADALTLEADADGGFEFPVPRIWIKREMLIKYLSVPEGEESNEVGVVVGSSGDYSAMITSRIEKIDAAAKLMVHNSLVFYDRIDKKTGLVSLMNCTIEGYNCKTIAKTKSSLNQKIFFTPKDTASFLIGVDDKYNILKVDPSGISRLNNKTFENPDDVVFLDIVAPVGGQFVLQTVGMKDTSNKLKLIPLKEAATADIGVFAREFKDSLGQSVAWTAASTLHSLNVYDRSATASTKLTVAKSSLDLDPARTAAKSTGLDISADSAEESEPEVDSQAVYSVLYQVDMLKTIEAYDAYMASGSPMDLSARELDPDPIHLFSRACHSLSANHKDFSKNFVMAFVCEDDKHVTQLVVSDGEKAFFVTSYTDTPVVGTPAISKNGTFIAYTVKLSETSSSLAVMHIPSGTQALIMKKSSLDGIRLINPKFAKNRPTVLTYIMKRSGTSVDSRQVGVIDLKHHKQFSSFLFLDDTDGETSDVGSEDEDLNHVFGEDSTYIRADVDLDAIPVMDVGKSL